MRTIRSAALPRLDGRTGFLLFVVGDTRCVDSIRGEDRRQVDFFFGNPGQAFGFRLLSIGASRRPEWLSSGFKAGDGPIAA